QQGLIDIRPNFDYSTTKFPTGYKRKRVWVLPGTYKGLAEADTCCFNRDDDLTWSGLGLFLLCERQHFRRAKLIYLYNTHEESPYYSIMCPSGYLTSSFSFSGGQKRWLCRPAD